MELIKTLTKANCERIRTLSTGKKLFLQAVGLPLTGSNYELGDTGVLIDNAVPYGLYKATHNCGDCYYLVMYVMDETMAFALTLYPSSRKIHITDSSVLVPVEVNGKTYNLSLCGD